MQEKISNNLNKSIPNEENKWGFMGRLLMALLFVGLSFGLFLVCKLMLKNLGLYDLIWGRIFAVTILIILVYAGYALYLRIFEKRKPVEYSLHGGFIELSSGILLGFGLITVQVIFLWVIGVYQIKGFSLSTGTIEIFLIAVITGFIEELINKGIIFRILEEGLGSWIAALVVALEVGLTHLTNPGATVMSTLAVSLEFGIMLSLFYMITRRLWLVTGFHFAWNFSLGGIYGLTVSGLETQGLLSSELQGSTYLTGGDFGIETALPAIVICSMLTLVLIFYFIKVKGLHKPFWAKLNM